MTVAVQDFGFMGGSLGMAAGEAFVKGAETALEKRTPYVLFAASGGARMQEGILSLMQMPRTTVAIRRLREAQLPYIVVLTNPTTGGVTASYAMLGDIHIAEPGALIGFAGPRVIEQTIREKLPDGFQRAEYLKEHGMVDMVVHRHELKATIARLCRPARPRRPRSPPEAVATAVVARAAGSRAGRASGPDRWSSSDALIARFLALHPKTDRPLARPDRSGCWRELGHPERRLPPVIHVAGTNGKGSTIAFMRAILESAGLRGPRLHLAASGALPRAHPARRGSGGGRFVDEERLVEALAPLRGGAMPASRSPSSRSPPRPPSCSSPRSPPTSCCSRSASAAGSTPPTSIDAPAAAVVTPDRPRPRGISRRHPGGDRRARRPASSSAAARP